METAHQESRAGRLHVSVGWLIVLGLMLLQGFFSLGHLAGLKTIGFMDTAHYYAVAKNIAQGKTNPDDILWHYLGQPPAVDRPAGDYWGAGWPYALGFLMRGAGDSVQAAFWICACLSVFLPVLVVLLLRRLGCRWWLAACGAVLVCLQTRLFQTMVTPDVSLSYELTTTAGFVAFLGVLKDRSSLLRLLPAALLLTLPIWLRGEGFVPLMAAMIGLLAAPWPWRERLRWAAALAVVAGIGLVPYVLYNVHCFGHITPPARALTPLMTDYKQLYEIGDGPTLDAYRQLGFGGIVGQRIEALKIFFDFAAHKTPYVLLLVGFFGPIGRWLAQRRAARREPQSLPDSRRRQSPDSGSAEKKRTAPQAAGGSRTGQPVSDQADAWRGAGIVMLWSFVVLSAAVPILLAPVVYNPSRFFTNSAPVLCVLAVWTLEPLFRCRWCANLGLLCAAAVLLAYLEWPLHLVKPWRTDWKEPCLNVPASLSPGNHPVLRPNDIVLTEIPCQLAAQLAVKSINAPQDDVRFDDGAGGESSPRFLHTAGRQGTVVSAQACRLVIERYHPQFIVAEDGSNLDQFVRRLQDLPIRVVSRGQEHDGRGFTWYAIAAGAPARPD